MQNPNLRFFDLRKFVNNLNASLDPREARIELGEFKDGKPKRTPLSYKWDDKVIEERGTVQLIQAVNTGILGAMLGLDSETSPGFLAVETGYLDVGSEYGGSYEKLSLCLREPLQLKAGRVIPTCRVRLIREVEELVEPVKKREDYVPGLFSWRETSLASVMPTEWFLSN